MTQPIPEPQVDVQVGTGVAPGPDGTPWVQVQFAVGPTAFAMVVPEATARRLAEILPGVLTAGADQARQARTGLVVASNGHTDLPPAELQRIILGGR